MELKASMVVMSHLSDAQETISYNEKSSSLHINFAKFVINKIKGDLTKMIDADVMWSEFEEFIGKRNVTVRRTISTYNSVGSQVDAVEMYASEIKEFIKGEVEEGIKNILTVNRTNSGKISAIQYLKKQAANKEKFIGLKDAKDIIDEIVSKL